jgi:hypothetical protein
MARYTFFSFAYEDVKNFKANVVRKSWLINNSEGTFIDGSIWETEKTKSPNEIKKLIELGLNKTSVTSVLIGDSTASRRWVKYEIVKSFDRGNGILGIHINRIRGRQQVISSRGLNPLDRLGFLVSDDGKKIYFYELINRKWEVYSDLPEINNKKSSTLYFDDHWWHGNVYGKFFRFSGKFNTYCWIMNDGHKNFSTWTDEAAVQAGR